MSSYFSPSTRWPNASDAKVLQIFVPHPLWCCSDRGIVFWSPDTSCAHVWVDKLNILSETGETWGCLSPLSLDAQAASACLCWDLIKMLYDVKSARRRFKQRATYASFWSSAKFQRTINRSMLLHCSLEINNKDQKKWHYSSQPVNGLIQGNIFWLFNQQEAPMYEKYVKTSVFAVREHRDASLWMETVGHTKTEQRRPNQRLFPKRVCWRVWPGNLNVTDVALAVSQRTLREVRFLSLESRNLPCAGNERLYQCICTVFCCSYKQV